MLVFGVECTLVKIMKLPFFSKNQSENGNGENTLLALDVGTQFVKAVIFQVVDQKVHVIGYAKTQQQSNSMHSAMIVNLQNVISTTDICVGSALTMAEQMQGGPVDLPNKVILGIAGELVKGVTIIADYERENPDKKIEQKEIDDVVAQVKEELFTKVHADIANEMGLNVSQVEEINTKIVSSHIDGVKIDNPIGFTGTSAKISIYSTFSPSLHLNSLRELASALGLEIWEIVVEPYAVARAVRDSHKESFSGIFIDIGGGTTDVAVVDKGAVMGTKMFAYGGQVFTKRLAKDFKLSMDDAEKLKMDYSMQKVSEIKESQIKKAFAKDIDVWTEGVELSLADFEDVKHFPDKMYFCGGGSLLPDVKAGLMSYPWLQVLPFQKFPKMSYIFPNQIEGLVDHTKKMIDPIDVAPAALARMALEL